MQRLARVSLTGAAVLALAGGLVAVGATTDDRPDGGPDRSALERVDDITRLQAHLVRVPEDHVSWSELGDAYLRESRSTADPTFYVKAEATYAKALALRPGHASAITGSAALAAARQDFGAALALADRALAADASDAAAYGIRSDALNGLGRYDEARAAAQQMTELRPGTAASTRAAYALALRGDVDGARAALEEAVRAATDPEDAADAQYCLGQLAWDEGDLPAARAAYEAGLEAVTDHAASRGGLAEVLVAEGDTELALDQLEELVEEVPAPRLLVQYGELLEATGDTEAAQEQYDAVRAAQQRQVENGRDVDTERALFEADHGEPEDALEAAQAAYAKRPQSVFTQDAYAWALHKAGRTRDALPVARAALRLGLRSPALHARVGTIEAAAGERGAARATLLRMMTLNPEFSPLHAPPAQELLASLS